MIATKLNVITAKTIATNEIVRVIKNSPLLSQYKFGDIKLKNENERFWTFSTSSDELFEQGFVPGALYVCVDKEDGHVLTDEEIESFYQDIADIHAA
jgi:hypothetical protein